MCDLSRRPHAAGSHLVHYSREHCEYCSTLAVVTKYKMAMKYIDGKTRRPHILGKSQDKRIKRVRGIRLLE